MRLHGGRTVAWPSWSGAGARGCLGLMSHDELRSVGGVALSDWPGTKTPQPRRGFERLPEQFLSPCLKIIHLLVWFQGGLAFA